MVMSGRLFATSSSSLPAMLAAAAAAPAAAANAATTSASGFAQRSGACPAGGRRAHSSAAAAVAAVSRQQLRRYRDNAGGNVAAAATTSRKHENDGLASHIGLCKEVELKFSRNKSILYSLAMGKTLDSARPSAQYLLGGRSDFTVLPLFGSIPARQKVQEVLKDQLHFDISQLVQNEHYFQLFRPMPPAAADLKSVVLVSDVLDKNIHAVILIDVATYDTIGDMLVMFNQFVFQVDGCGGFGGPKVSRRLIRAPHNPVNDVAPNKIIHTRTNKDQSILCRLLVESEGESRGGSEAAAGQLDGLSVLGMVARSLQEEYGISEQQFHCIKAVFGASVRPGETLETWTWRTSYGRIFFSTIERNTGRIVLSGGYLTLI